MNRCRLAATTILLVACGGEEPVVSIEDFERRSPGVQCTRIEGAVSDISSVVTFQPVDDSTFLAIDDAERRVFVINADARVLSEQQLPLEGSDAVGQLMDAALSGDSLLVVADGGRNRLTAFSPTGAHRWTIDLGFPPQRIVVVGQRILVAALGMDPRVPGLVHERAGDHVVPLPIPFIAHADALARGFANSVTMHGLADGSVVVAHEMVWPRAWRIAGAGAIERRAIPVPDAIVRSIGYMPPMPLRREDLDDIAMPVISMSVDAVSGEMLYLTRTDEKVGGHQEKAIVRIARDFSYLGSNRLGINATEIAWLRARPDSVIAVDTDLRWHRCPVPDASNRADR